MRKRENKNYSSVPFLSDPKQKIKKKNEKKFKKLKDTIMASFRAKIRRKMMRKRETKNYHSVPFRFNPTLNRKFQKKQQKNFKN